MLRGEVYSVLSGFGIVVRGTESDGLVRLSLVKRR